MTLDAFPNYKFNAVVLLPGHSYYDEGSEGLKVALLHHLDMPIMRQTGFHIAPGTENQVWLNQLGQLSEINHMNLINLYCFQIAVTPTLISTSDSAMRRFTPPERDCYSEDEISLKYLPARDDGLCTQGCQISLGCN